MTWLQRLERMERKHRRMLNRRNVQAYRERRKQAGMRRVDLLLAPEHYALLRVAMRPGEAISATVARLLQALPVTPT